MGADHLASALGDRTKDEIGKLFILPDLSFIADKTVYILYLYAR